MLGALGGHTKTFQLKAEEWSRKAPFLWNLVALAVTTVPYVLCLLAALRLVKLLFGVPRVFEYIVEFGWLPLTMILVVTLVLASAGLWVVSVVLPWHSRQWKVSAVFLVLAIAIDLFVVVTSPAAARSPFEEYYRIEVAMDYYKDQVKFRLGPGTKSGKLDSILSESDPQLLRSILDPLDSAIIKLEDSADVARALIDSLLEDSTDAWDKTELLSYLAVALSRQKEWDSAATVLDSAIALSGSDVYLVFQKHKLHYKAAEFYRRKNADSLAEYHSNRSTDAVKQFARLRSRSGIPDEMFKARFSWSLGDHTRALSSIESAIEKNRSYAELYKLKSQVLFELAQPDNDSLFNLSEEAYRKFDSLVTMSFGQAPVPR